MLQFDAAAKKYTRRRKSVDALLPTTLEVADGDYVAIVGPSGSGKTTMLSMLGGMLAPTSGRVLLDGRSLYEESVAVRARIRSEKIGFVFQHFNLVPWLNALENVQLPLAIYGTDPRTQRRRAEVLLDRFGLSDRADHKPAELSTGQQQRVALARTLIHNPAVILADEPTGNLDGESRQAVLECLAECHSTGRTIVLVTHDTAVARQANRILQITGGTVESLPTRQVA